MHIGISFEFPNMVIIKIKSHEKEFHNFIDPGYFDFFGK